MQHNLLNETDGLRLFAVVLEPGEEAMASITKFSADQGITGASVSAIGAFQDATVGWFDPASKNYREIAVDEQCEVLSLLGDIGKDESGKPSVHLHTVLGLSDGSTRGGHLMAGIVRPTLEVIVTESPAYLCRQEKPELGVALLNLDQPVEKQALMLAERSNLSPNQAKALIQKHGDDSESIEEEARLFKAES